VAKEKKDKVEAKVEPEVVVVPKVETKAESKATGWVKVNLDELLALQAEGKVAGYNKKTEKALIVEVK